jgi:hypothetical protein
VVVAAVASPTCPRTRASSSFRENLDVEQDQVRALAPRDAEGLAAVRRRHRVMSREPEAGGDRVAKDRLVVYY